MGQFRVLSRVDAFVDYVAEIAYAGGPGVVWKQQGTTEFDARRVVTLDTDGEEIDATAQGDF